MQRTLINTIKKQVGKKVKICGFIHTIRDQGNIKFVLVRDASGTIQTVVTKINKEAFQTAKSLNLESVVEIIGLVKEERQAPDGIEIEIKEIKILSQAALELPIPVTKKTKNEASEVKRLNFRWLDLRKPEKLLIFKVWTEMEKAFREYWLKHGYIQIHSPKLMSTASESGAEVFEVKYFNRKAYLAQSPQFYKQMAMAAGFEKVFEVGPAFRAEPSFTPRHATEFTGYDAEISFIKSHQDVIKEEEKLLVFALQKIKEKFGKEILKAYRRQLIVPETPFPQVTMKEAKEILKKMKVPSEKQDDLSPEEERKLSKYFKKIKNHEFVFVTEYPIEVRPFYHMRKETGPSVTKSYDLLYNGIEITTGAQREHRYEILKKQAEEKGVNLKSIQNYLNFFKYGCPPHGGMGIGPERMLMKIFNIKSIREVAYLYRGVKRLEP